MKNLDVDFIKGCAIGRWLEIISSLAPRLMPTVERGRRHGPCDLCGGKDRCRCHNDFSETGGIFCNQCRGGSDGLAVLCWANSWTFRESLESVASYVGLNDASILPPVNRTSRPQPKKDWVRELKQLEQTWCEAQSGTSRLQQYFESRGLSIAPPNTLRLHPNLPYYNEDSEITHHPAMLAQIIRGDELVGLHRTYLDSNRPGKANVPSPKKSLKCDDSLNGGAIKLFDLEPDQPLVLVEGIETALAVHDYSGWPVWSGLNRILLEKVELPERVKSVVICGDKDKSGDGQESADKLAQRLANDGREVKISLPPIGIPENSKSVDWLDFLTQEVTHVR